MKKASVRTFAAVCAAALVLAACGSKPAESQNDEGATNDTSSTSSQEDTGEGSGDTGESEDTGEATEPTSDTATEPTEGGSESESTDEGSAEPASDMLGCMVTDTGGIDDRSFNASAWKGLQNAEADLGVKGKYLSSTAPADYIPNINAFVQQDCDLIVTVGFLMGDQTKKVASENPDQPFAIVDFSYDPPLDNVLGLIYNTAQAGFLGGYLAAGLTKTGKVATYGGMKLPTVTIYMDGYWEGVNYYNEQNDTSVEVLGWNEETQNGVFTNDFTDQAKGQQVTKTFMSQGADIVFPVAGNVGLGSAKAAAQSDGALKLLWVDSDGCESAAQYCDVMYASVVKGIAASVEKAMKEVVNGSFEGGNYVGTLENGGAGLVYGSSLADDIPQKLKDQIKQIKADIISGKITITSPSQPSAG